MQLNEIEDKLVDHLPGIRDQSRRLELMSYCANRADEIGRALVNDGDTPNMRDIAHHRAVLALLGLASLETETVKTGPALAADILRLQRDAHPWLKLVFASGEHERAANLANRLFAEKLQAQVLTERKWMGIVSAVAKAVRGRGLDPSLERSDMIEVGLMHSLERVR